MADGTRDVDTAPWQNAATKILAFAEEKGVRIVGLIGDRTGVGVSLLCHELARAYARHGINVLLVDVSRVDVSAPPAPPGQAVPLDLVALATTIEPGFAQIDLAEHSAVLPAGRQAIGALFEGITSQGGAIVVDLPAANAGAGQRNHTAGLIGSACQHVYLVCMSGLTKKAELTDTMKQCAICKIPVEGIIINDWKQPIAWLATEW